MSAVTLDLGQELIPLANLFTRPSFLHFLNLFFQPGLHVEGEGRRLGNQ